ncbi:MAG: C-GCAxxG-C-C family protein [Negativicutes bacterium]|nr:C-GCAxxG-C-C family protein [Negativicutes bacterium]
MSLHYVNQQHALGFNCAQIVLAAFAEPLGLDTDTARRLAAGFGGGLYCGEVCGAYAAAVMVLGLRYGSAADAPAERKALLKAKVQLLQAYFLEEYPGLRCLEILGSTPAGLQPDVRLTEAGLPQEICPAIMAFVIDTLPQLL